MVKVFNFFHDSHHQHNLLTKLGLRIRKLIPQVVNGTILGTIVF